MHTNAADAGKDAPSKDKPAAQPDQPQSQPK
jgi:hypothetical protein